MEIYPEIRNDSISNEIAEIYAMTINFILKPVFNKIL